MMLQWRLKLHEARQALTAGRYEEASRVLSDAQLREFLPAKQLAGQLAQKYTERAAQRIAWGQSSAGFADLAAVDQLGGRRDQADAIRHDYAAKVESSVLASLVAQEPKSALALLERAGRRGVDSPWLRSLNQIAQSWAEADEHADAGDMARAEAALARCVRLVDAAGSEEGTMPRVHSLAEALAKSREALGTRATQHRAARERLNAVAIAKDWSAVLQTAEESQRYAPRDQAVLNLRRRAWRALELDQTRALAAPRATEAPRAMTRENKNQPEAKRPAPRELAKAIRDTSRAPASAKDDTAAGRPAAERRMLWVDSVGGFLVCLDSEIVLGQPAGGAAPTVPVLADISRRHAILRRDRGAYVLEPVGATKLDGREVTGPTVLGESHLIELGQGVRIRFSRPHALSATARLKIESGHRTAPSADAVLLMAESCVLGPGRHSHVRCRNWEQDVVLFRQHDQLVCRSTAPLTIDGLPAEGPVTIGEACRVEGQDFAFGVELV